jgi:hypothetical protein
MSPETLEGGTAQTKHKTADQSTTSATLSDVDDLWFDVEANMEYSFDFVVPCKSSNAIRGIALAVSCPTLVAPAYIAYRVEIPQSADGTGSVSVGAGTASDDAHLSSGVVAANTVYVARVFGVLKNGSTSGQLRLRFATEITGADSATIMEGAFGTLYPQPV